ncbi:MAG: hypothetical protein Q8O40_08000 [Chloroflexota bacterium]|nr:hypothetical protein [Chloroflexota bacterium]
MTRVYAIHTGSYSDQTWGPVFSTVEKALAHKAKSDEREMNIEVHVLDDENDTGPVYPCWRLIFDRGGNVLFSEHFAPSPYEPALPGEATVERVPPNCRWYMLDEIKERQLAHLLVSGVYAPDLDHAVKIAADARRQFLAEAKP